MFDEIFKSIHLISNQNIQQVDATRCDAAVISYVDNIDWYKYRVLYQGNEYEAYAVGGQIYQINQPVAIMFPEKTSTLPIYILSSLNQRYFNNGISIETDPQNPGQSEHVDFYYGTGSLDFKSMYLDSNQNFVINAPLTNLSIAYDATQDTFGNIQTTNSGLLKLYYNNNDYISLKAIQYSGNLTYSELNLDSTFALNNLSDSTTGSNSIYFYYGPDRNGDATTKIYADGFGALNTLSNLVSGTLTLKGDPGVNGGTALFNYGTYSDLSPYEAYMGGFTLTATNLQADETTGTLQTNGPLATLDNHILTKKWFDTNYPGFYGAFYDTTIQTNAAGSTVNIIQLNTIDIANGVTIAGNSSSNPTRVTIAHAGTYNIQFSAQLDKTDSGVDNIDIWLRKNGVNITYTNTRVELNGNNDKAVAAWNWMVSAAANDHYEIAWSSADVDLRLYAESALTGPTRPDIPSVIVTVQQVTGLIGTGGGGGGGGTTILAGNGITLTAGAAGTTISVNYLPLNLTGFYGSFYSGVSQGVTSTTIAYKYKFDGTVTNNAVYVDGTTTSRIYVQNSGTYAVHFSSQLYNPNASAQTANIWLSKNGVNVDNTDGQADLSGRIVASWNYLLPLNAGDYVELNYRFSDTSMVNIAYPTTGTPLRPAVPSIILNMWQTSNLLGYAAGTGLTLNGVTFSLLNSGITINSLNVTLGNSITLTSADIGLSEQLTVNLGATTGIGGYAAGATIAAGLSLTQVLKGLFSKTIPYTYVDGYYDSIVKSGGFNSNYTSLEVGTIINQTSYAVFHQKDLGASTSMTFYIANAPGSGFAGKSITSISSSSDGTSTDGYTFQKYGITYSNGTTTIADAISFQSYAQISTATGRQGKDNFGNNSGSPLAATTKTSNTSQINGYRSWFAGYTSGTSLPTGTNIRSYTSIGEAYKGAQYGYGNEFTVPSGTKIFFISFPISSSGSGIGTTMTRVYDRTNFQDYLGLGSMLITTTNVPGANSYAGITYTTYYYINGQPAGFPSNTNFELQI
jgi:hypothetical protein